MTYGIFTLTLRVNGNGNGTEGQAVSEMGAASTVHISVQAKTCCNMPPITRTCSKMGLQPQFDSLYCIVWCVKLCTMDIVLGGCLPQCMRGYTSTWAWAWAWTPPGLGLDSPLWAWAWTPPLGLGLDTLSVDRQTPVKI